MTKSNKPLVILFLILGVFVTPTLLFYEPFEVTNASTDSIYEGIITDDGSVHLTINL